MARLQMTLSWTAALLLGLTACNSAYADRLAPAPANEKALAHSPAQSPYQVDLIGENGRTLDVYQHRGRFYVLGSVGQRYTIRVTNPTHKRVEALVSVDGLDVIDGKTADLGKRGYVVPAGGELRIDGFRVSTQQVATFRFSSVSNSYAGRKGKARNVGVIGVAIFEERAPQEIIVAEPTPRPRPRPHRRVDKPYDYRNDLKDARAERKAEDDGADFDMPEAEAAPAPAPTAGGQSGGIRGNAGLGVGRSAGAPAPAAKRPANRPASRRSRSISSADSTSALKRDPYCCQKRKKKSRPGLGTEFGERRQSAVSWTRFVRANEKVPSAMAELRYNDAGGLQALGIQLAPVDPGEIETRETANPFPGGFAQPPR